MAAAKHNIVIEQGVDFDLEIQLKNADGTVIDLSGYNAGISDSQPHFLAKIKRTPERDEVVRFTTTKMGVESGDTPSSGSAGRTGRVRLSLTDTQTLTLTNTSYVYDLYRRDSAGNWFRDLEGEIEVIEGVSR